MKINKFIAKNVHGYLNYDINFFENLTFLIGINGSGKTSAIKLILGLISPSYQYLSQIEFDEATIICSSTKDECDIEITAKVNKKKNVFTVYYKKKNSEIISSQEYRTNFKFENEYYNLDEISFVDQQQSELFDNDIVTKTIRNLSSPKFLGLDRKIYDGQKIDLAHLKKIYFNQNKKRNNDKRPGQSHIDSSLEDVQNLVYAYFRRIANEQPKISEDFKRKIFQLSFKFNNQSNLDFVPSNSEELLQKKINVLNALESLDMKYLNPAVENFFSKMINIISDSNKLTNQNDYELNDDEKEIYEKNNFELIVKWINNNSQLKSINEIIEYSENYQKKISDLRSPIKKLERIVSAFLKEGNKSLIVKGDGEIKVKIKEKFETSIFELSSGEKQIIIMIAHLIFDEDLKSSGIFIIDEPELSLHIAWQEIFVDSILNANPKTQFILATHSPSIVAKVDREKLCQDINILN